MPVSAGATLTKRDNKNLTGLALTGVARQALLTAATTSTATLTKAVNKGLTVVTPPAAFVFKSAGKKYTATVTALATVTHGTATQIKTLTANVTSVGSYTLSAAREFKTGSLSLPLPPIFSSASPITTLVRTFVPGRVLTATVGSTSSMVKRASRTYIPDVVAATATISAIKALSIKLLSASTASAVTMTMTIGQTARTATVTAVAGIQKTTNQIASAVLSCLVSPLATLSYLFGEDAPAHPSQAGLVLTNVAKGALSLASRTKQALIRKDI